MRLERSKRAEPSLAALALLLLSPLCVADDATTTITTSTPYGKRSKLINRIEYTIAVLYDPASRGTAIYGDPCSLTIDCGFPDSVCDENLKTCQCDPQKPVTNYVDKCGKHICREPFKLRQKNPDRDTFKHLVQNDD
ncbi:hypothetical protein MSG28_002637 [Choristoneura fumiferana]|uniref:Uncharacterized protein n=1 Tax=Choristoneura fumiferana TaxID=7141 RepID=A0ACC0JIJ4_CHOFU|nr:hypothetical protein MSG28_002637 [Choristoneura fumiferana]